MTKPCRDVAVIGAGIIGLGVAWEAVRRGHRVTLIDPSPASGATRAAAGMLAPVSELQYREERFLELTRESALLYPAFIDELANTGVETGYRSEGTLVLGLDPADRLVLADLRAAQVSHGLTVDELTIREARRREPLIGPAATGAFLVPGDHQVDPRQLASALFSALAGNARLLEGTASGLIVEGGRVTGVALDDGSSVSADETVVANGLGAPALASLPVALPVRPVYGDILRLRVPAHLRPFLTTTVRGLVRGNPVYLVPRTDGTVVIGATQREDGRRAVSAGGVYQLLRDAQQLVPAVVELDLVESMCRARPGTPDNAPLLGRVSGVEGLVVATGFFRHGVLLTPVAARICADLLDGKPAAPEHNAYRPDRFGKGSS
ncbi:glycine oxidase ThiO [Arthrobacter sp. H5]|uniref:glycine oxidase ThiO n=1 Tax=Arthrobacter sp. H5 TaxID=1267973 RepID=UPI0004898389|nr:glycine oxidase ThiO [Arthrobacter sp. H5]